MTHLRVSFAIAVVTVTAVIPLAHGDGDNGRAFKAKNESGEARTINVAGFAVVDPDNPFFLDLGTNGRRCVTCHQPADNMSVSASSIAERFEKTSGDDPIFRLNDGANSPLADVSTREQRRRAYSMLLTKGVIRVGLRVPENAEFFLAAVADPYGYAGKNANGNELSLFAARSRRRTSHSSARSCGTGERHCRRDRQKRSTSTWRTSPIPRRRAMPRRPLRSTRRRAS